MREVRPGCLVARLAGSAPRRRAGVRPHPRGPARAPAARAPAAGLAGVARRRRAPGPGPTPGRPGLPIRLHPARQASLAAPVGTTAPVPETPVALQAARRPERGHYAGSGLWLNAAAPGRCR